MVMPRRLLWITLLLSAAICFNAYTDKRAAEANLKVTRLQVQMDELQDQRMDLLSKRIDRLR